MKLTNHAKIRAQQRGIRQEAIEAIFHHGRTYYCGQGYHALHLDRRAVRVARKRGLRLEAYKNLALVLSHDGAVVTVYHAQRLPRTWTPE